MKFKAEIRRNLRNIHRIDTKILLRFVTNLEDGTEFRDHCWVPFEGEIEKYRPYKDKYPLTITFEADIDTYKTVGPEKNKLSNIRNITIIKPKRR